VRQGFAYAQGMKVALFDITDVNHPVEKYAVQIGDRGTHSEVLNNHRALLFNREQNLLAFPIIVAEIQNKSTSTPQWEYGSFVFQGAYVYDLSIDRGFTLRGKLTHRSDQDYLKAGLDWYPGNRDINRILYIKDTLYTLSDGMVQANDLGSLARKGGLELPRG
ncbi:MAG: beta-propeller domain-containing protein, partial [Bacillota bacterium]|nr:beta-propeller domain-containing protein [Bacillota bacterium]